MNSTGTRTVPICALAILLGGSGYHATAAVDMPRASNLSPTLATPTAMPVSETVTAVFIGKAARAGTFGIEASTLALQQSTSARIKAFAEVMIKDHSRLTAELRTAAGTTPLPADLDPSQLAKLAQLKLQSGTDFDRFYVADVAVAAHEDAVALFEAYGRHGPQGPVKQYAQKNLAGLQEHLRMGKELQPLATTARVTTRSGNGKPPAVCDHLHVSQDSDSAGS